MIGELIAAAIGTMAFALLFGVPKKYYIYFLGKKFLDFSCTLR